MVNKVTFVGFRGEIAPFAPLWIRPCVDACTRVALLEAHSTCNILVGQGNKPNKLSWNLCPHIYLGSWDKCVRNNECYVTSGYGIHGNQFRITFRSNISKIVDFLLCSVTFWRCHSYWSACWANFIKHHNNYIILSLSDCKWLTHPLLFVQVSDPVAAEFSLNTNFFLLSKKALYLSDGSMGFAEDSDVAFPEGSLILQIQHVVLLCVYRRIYVKSNNISSGFALHVLQK